MYMLSRVLAFSSQRIDEQYNSRLVWNIPGGRGILSQGVPHLRYCIQISISGDTLTLVMSVRVPSSFCASSLQKGAKSMIYTYIYIIYIHTCISSCISWRFERWEKGWKRARMADNKAYCMYICMIYDVIIRIYTHHVSIYICKYITIIKEHTNIQNITYIYTHICILHTLHREYGHTDTSNTLDMSKAKNPGIWVFSPIWWEFDQITVKHLLIHGPMVKTRWKIIKTPGFLKLRQHCINPVTWRHGAETWQKKQHPEQSGFPVSMIVSIFDLMR